MNRINQNWHYFIWAIAVMNVAFAFVQLADGRSLAAANSLAIAVWVGLAGSYYKQLVDLREENAEIRAQAIAQATAYRAFKRYHVVSHGRPLPEEKELQ